MLAGLIAGAVAAIVASLVSLPLRSPLDVAFNTATVTLASLIVGILTGLLWTLLAANPGRIQRYAGVLAAAFMVLVVLALVGNIWLERFASFTIPLAAIAIAVSGILTPLLGGMSVAAVRGLAVVSLIASVGLGVALAGQGDTASGDLSLPARVEAPTQIPTEPPAPAMTPETAPATAVATVPAMATEAVSTGAAPTDAPTTPTAAPATVPPAEPTAPSATPVGEGEGASGGYVVGEGSEITFTVGEVLTRFPTPIQAVMRSTKLSGQINLDGQPSTVAVDLHSLASDQDFRDRYVRTRMFPNDPVASFTVDTVTELPAEFHSGDEFERQVSGTLNLKGESIPLTFDLEVRKDGDILTSWGVLCSPGNR